MRRLIFVAATALTAAALTATAAAAIEPGQWDASTRMTDITLPANVPAQVADMMRQQMGDNTVSSSSCITQEDIDNAPERMFQESQGECEYSRFDMVGGTINAAAQCTTDEGTMDMVMTGTYTDTAYAMTMNLAMESPMGNMTFTSEITGQRVGPCS